MNEWEYEALRKSPLFDGISYQEFDEILNCFKPIIRYYSKGDVIFQAGATNQGYGIILKGCASAYHENVEGDKKLLYTATPGGFIGVVAAIFAESQFAIDLVADEDCIIVFMSPFTSRGCSQMTCNGMYCADSRKVMDNFISLFLVKAFYLYKRTVFLTMKSVRQKVCAYLLDQQRTHGELAFNLTLDRVKLADYLNMPRPSLSRELCNLRNKGLIDFERNTIIILNLEGIVRYASGSDY